MTAHRRIDAPADRPGALRLLLGATLAAGLLLGLGACGKKGPPRAPEGQESEYTYPQPYPAPESVVPGRGEDPSEDGFLTIFTGDDRRSRTTTYE